MLIVAGGFQAGRPWAAAVAAVLLALGFLGLAHALIETTAGKAPAPRPRRAPGLRGVAAARGASPSSLPARARRRRRSGCPAARIVDALAQGARDDAYRDARSSAALADGWRFAGLHATADGARRPRRCSSRPTATLRLETVAGERRRVPSIVDLAPAAGWDEREAHDLYGVALRRPRAAAAARRPRPRRSSTGPCPCAATTPYQVAVGPIHAGVIESGHFRFHVVGDRILHLDARLFYKHRGLERAAEGTTLDDGLAYAARACAACAVANGVAYAHACEEALGLRADAELARARTILLELERIWSHLNDIAAVCAGVGLAAGNNCFAALTERARRLNARAHRAPLPLRHRSRRRQRARPSTRRRRAPRARSSQRSRAGRAARLARAALQRVVPGPAARHRRRRRRRRARGSAPSGPAARAAGLADDARADAAGSPTTASSRSCRERAAGDVQARLEQRALELRQTFDAARRACSTGRSRPPPPSRAASERAIGVGRVESPRGATSCVVERSGDRIERLRLRTGSYANWPSVAHAAAGNLLPDFPLINKSFELCYACADR